MTIRDRAREARERAERANRGPWRECGADRGGCECGQVWSKPAGDEGVLVFIRGNDPEDEGVPLATLDEGKANACFAAHARTDVPDLASALERLLGPDTLSLIAKTLYGGGGLTASDAAVKADDVMRLIERIAEGERR